MRSNANVVGWRGVVAICLAVLWAASGGAPPVQAASSSDYPGPCRGEQVAVSAPETPLYLAADYHGLNPDLGIITMPDFGRIRLGISCVGTGYGGGGGHQARTWLAGSAQRPFRGATISGRFSR